MLLTADIGNTNITLGLYEDDKYINEFRLASDRDLSGEEYEILLKSLFKDYVIDGCVIASVVEELNIKFKRAVDNVFNIKSVFVTYDINLGVKVATDNPREVGADRIVDLVAGYELYGGPALVIDYGTATTYDVVTENGVFLAGVIAPGIRTSANVLYRDAARLPEIEILKPKTILANSTIDSMQAGLYYGVVGETKYMVQKMKEETGFDNMKVIATGGLGNMIAQTVDEIDYYDPTLTLKGLQIIYEKQ